MDKKIIITVSPTGETTVQTTGYTGPACKDASRFIEEALGEKTAERLTPEYHQPAKRQNHTNQGN
jgi:Protein of unknown function (DUF2997)